MIELFVEINIFHWIGFLIIILILLFIDLGVFNRKRHVISYKEALIWTAIWIIIALIFNVFVYYFYGKDKAIEYFTGYLIEKSLSVDNIFVFVLLFTYFNVPKKNHHRVLFWGILGAIIFRGILIAIGTTLIHKFHWIIFIFGGFLIISGIKMGFQKDEKVEPEKNPFVKLLRKFFPITPRYVKGAFFIRSKGKLYATPLLIVLIVIETTDIVFAFDSIPAILAITHDPFIVFTSNIFAILGLRALYFAIDKFIDKFRYLKYGLSVILVYIGIKMLISEVYKIPTLISLGFLVFILTIAVLASIIIKPKTVNN